MSDDTEVTSRISLAVFAFLKRQASGNSIPLGEYLKELEEAGELSREEILAVVDAVMRAYDQGQAS